MKILIIQSDTNERTLLITPVIRSLKIELDAEVHLAINHSFMELFQENPYVHRLHRYDQSVMSLRQKLKIEAFDVVIDLKNNFRSQIARTRIGSKTIVFKRKRLKSWLFVKTKINLLPSMHLVDQYMTRLQSLGIKGDNLGLDFYIPDKDEVENEWLPVTHQHGYAAVSISASHKTKQLPVNRLIELCDRINKPIVLIGSKEDMELAAEIEGFFRQGSDADEAAIAKLNKKAIIFNSCGKFNFNQSASLVKNASWVFTYDNTMMQIAAAFKKRIYTIWGSSSPHFGSYPYRAQFIIFENNKLNCRPCSLTGFKNCPKGHFKCMNDLTFDFYLPD